MSAETTRRGTLVRGVGSFYTVRTPEGEEFTLRCKKKFRRERLSPLAGDEVLFSPGQGEEHGWLDEILPRKTECLRPPVANVTLLIIVIAPVPEADMLLVDRQLSRAAAQDMRAAIAVNKTDLDATTAQRVEREYRKTGIPVIPVSAKDGTGLKDLRNLIRGGGLCCLTGQSGVGKSTLLNALLNLSLETGEISRKIARGKNTTRHTELLESEGMRVMDTAGFNLLEAEEASDPALLRERYPDFAPYEGKCRFRECMHDREPGCAVREAAARGEISPERWERYRLLLAEMKEVWRDRYD